MTLILKFNDMRTRKKNEKQSREVRLISGDSDKLSLQELLKVDESKPATGEWSRSWRRKRDAR